MLALCRCGQSKMTWDYNHGNKGDGDYCISGSAVSFLLPQTDPIKHPVSLELFTLETARCDV